MVLIFIGLCGTKVDVLNAIEVGMVLQLILLN